MTTNIVTIKIQEKDGRRWLLIQLALSCEGADKRKRATTVALAIAVLGLVILLALQIAPPLGVTLLRLLGAP
jgi:hypothetical protein